MGKSPQIWSDYTSPEFRSVDPMRTIAILPIAATEQHGPHLPLCTDTAINRGHLDALVAAAPAYLDFRILPVQEIGKSNEHLRMPGTLTLPATVPIEHVDRDRTVGRAVPACTSSFSSTRTAATRRSWVSSRGNCVCGPPCLS